MMIIMAGGWTLSLGQRNFFLLFFLEIIEHKAAEKSNHTLRHLRRCINVEVAERKCELIKFQLIKTH